MISFPGDTLASRVASSLLNVLGCPELIADSYQDYVKKVPSCFINDPANPHHLTLVALLKLFDIPPLICVGSRLFSTVPTRQRFVTFSARSDELECTPRCSRRAR
jgi:hypothetical protein